MIAKRSTFDAAGRSTQSILASSSRISAADARVQRQNVVVRRFWQQEVRQGQVKFSSTSTFKRYQRQNRFFSSTAKVGANEADFYKTLGVGRNASQQDIKSQFYKLSKLWHPDRNQGSEESKAKFQKVSEAYATLSQEQSRKQYDRQTSASAFGSPRGRAYSSGFATSTSDNSQRRATASYAWEYQRRTAARAHRRATAGDAHFHHKGPSSYSSAGAGSGGSSSFNQGGVGGATAFGTGGAFGFNNSTGGTSSNGAQSTLFERLAEQQRKREENLAARPSASASASSPSATAAAAASDRRMGNEDVSSSHLVRFLQITAMLSLIGYIASITKAKDQPGSRRRA